MGKHEASEGGTFQKTPSGGMGGGKQKLPKGWKKEKETAELPHTVCHSLWKWQKVPWLLPKRRVGLQILCDCRRRSSSPSLVESCSLSPALLHTPLRTRKSKRHAQGEPPSTPSHFPSLLSKGLYSQSAENCHPCPIVKADASSWQTSLDFPVSPGLRTILPSD